MKHFIRTSVWLIVATMSALPAMAQIGRRFPSEKKVVIDPVTGVELLFLTSQSGTGDSKIYQTHNQWTSDGQWVVFRSDRVPGEAMAVNESTGDIVQVTEGGSTGMLCVARNSMHLYYMRPVGKGKQREMDMEVVEVDLSKLFADSENNTLKKKKHYERICGVIPAEMGARGDMALDGSEAFAYFRLGKQYAGKFPIKEEISGTFGPRNMGAGPSGIGKIDLTTGEVSHVVLSLIHI